MISEAFVRVISSASGPTGSLKTHQIGVFHGVFQDFSHPDTQIQGAPDKSQTQWSFLLDSQAQYLHWDWFLKTSHPKTFPPRGAGGRGAGSQGKLRSLCSLIFLSLHTESCPASSEVSCSTQGEFKAITTPNYYQLWKAEIWQFSERLQVDPAAHAMHSGNWKINI